MAKAAATTSDTVEFGSASMLASWPQAKPWLRVQTRYGDDTYYIDVTHVNRSEVMPMRFAASESDNVRVSFDATPLLDAYNCTIDSSDGRAARMWIICTLVWPAASRVRVCAGAQPPTVLRDPMLWSIRAQRVGRRNYANLRVTPLDNVTRTIDTQDAHEQCMQLEGDGGAEIAIDAHTTITVPAIGSDLRIIAAILCICYGTAAAYGIGRALCGTLCLWPHQTLLLHTTAATAALTSTTTRPADIVVFATHDSSSSSAQTSDSGAGGVQLGRFSSTSE